MHHKAATKKSYENTAHQFAVNVANLTPLESIERFCKLLPPKAKILDIGCGSGRDAKVLSEKGLDVLGIDYSTNLLNIAKETAPKATFELMDIEEISFPKGSFDGVWAASSFCHIPKKVLPSILSNIHHLLKDKGHFYLTVRKGEGEIFEPDMRYEGEHHKFWAFYVLEEIKELVLQARFHVVECCEVPPKMPYQTIPSIRLFCHK